eukprot:gb/GEZN01006228.1/.p1 GENE.gb/GEZN01006228.1/~~gb/GEZN01006228.1/.p1  ORF type:complete len:466 (+),score=51.72 gb/GEZN01006228.1/:100-1497(+)
MPLVRRGDLKISGRAVGAALVAAVGVLCVIFLLASDNDLPDVATQYVAETPLPLNGTAGRPTSFTSTLHWPWGGSHATPAPPCAPRLWTYWDYPEGKIPSLVELNVRTWLHHHPSLKLTLVNDSNIKEFVPDLPQEWYRLPYSSAKSDVLRAAVIYHHGGVFMDAEVLVMYPLDTWLALIRQNWSIVSYGDPSIPAQQTECRNDSLGWNSNAHAGGQGNVVSCTWWENIKKKLTRVCLPGEYSVEKVCCHVEGRADLEKAPCHVPWGQLELLKTPQANPDVKYMSDAYLAASNASKALLATANASNSVQNWTQPARLYCMHGNRSFIPTGVGIPLEIYTMPRNAKVKQWLSAELGQYCQTTPFRDSRSPSSPFPPSSSKSASLSSQTLYCHDTSVDPQNGIFRQMPLFFNRTAYQISLTFMKLGDLNGLTADQILQGDFLISFLYRKSLGLAYNKSSNRTTAAPV